MPHQRDDARAPGAGCHRPEGMVPTPHRSTNVMIIAQSTDTIHGALGDAK